MNAFWYSTMAKCFIPIPPMHADSTRCGVCTRGLIVPLMGRNEMGLWLRRRDEYKTIV